MPGSARVDVVVRPGDWVTQESPLARVWGADGADDALRERVGKLFAVQSERDVAEDVGFGLRQLADIAFRAISPGVNDPTPP